MQIKQKWYNKCCFDGKKFVFAITRKSLLCVLWLAEELTNQRDALIAEIQCIKSAHTAEVERLGTDHRSALSALEERLHGEREDAVNEGTGIPDGGLVSVKNVIYLMELRDHNYDT